MIRKPIVAVAALVLTLLVAAGVAGAATWGQATNVWFDTNSNRWVGTVDDTRRDGYCVSLWTITSNGVKLDRIARSCGAPVTGASSGTWVSESTAGVRMFRYDGRYETIIWPT